MATQALPRVGLVSERRFFFGMAVALALATFAGFSRTYYLMAWTGAPELAWVVHLHGLVFTAWMLLFVAQAGLISAGRVDVHMRVGMAGVVLGLLVIGLGIFVALTRSAPPRLVPIPVERFVIFSLTSIFLFGLFFGLAIANRHRPDWHKRFMLVATINVVLPALARATVLLPFLPRGVMGGMIIANLFLAILLLFDWRSRGRIHPATAWGVGITLVAEPLRFMIAWSDWWPPIGRALISLI